jgi:murein DD-endopeptidase MepM/ murein hydrolase activator NlpD
LTEPSRWRARLRAPARHFAADNAWASDALAVALLYAAFVAVVRARLGLTALILWNVAPILFALAVVILLAAALLRSWRRAVLTKRDLVGFAALALVVVSLATFRTYPSSHDDDPSDVRFRLPLDGPVTVVWGGPTRAVNYHATMPDQRWAVDLLVTVNGRTFRNDGTRLDDYYAYGRPVLAPAAGITRVVYSGEPDRPIGQSRVLRSTGNYIVLEVAPDEFLFVAHLQPGSITVAPGDRVTAGQVIGHVGNSGNSSEPHVHVHLQDRVTRYLGESIPFYFHDYLLRGLKVERGMPLGGLQRARRGSPARFTGDVVEDSGRLPPSSRLRAKRSGEARRSSL